MAHALKLHHTLILVKPLNPTASIFHKLLNPRPQLRLMQRKIIHSPNPHENLTGKPLSNSIHQTSTSSTEVIRHCLVRTDGLGLPEGAEIGFPAEVFEVGRENGEVGGEHGGSYFAAVGAVADECCYEAWAMEGLWGVRDGDRWI
jgi:hypothetical protein